MITKCICFLIVAYSSYIYGQNETELCGEDSFNKGGDRCRGALKLVEESQAVCQIETGCECNLEVGCIGQLINIPDIDDKECSEDSFSEEGITCLGDLIPFEEPEEECSEDSFKEEGVTCLGELIPIEELVEECSENSFKEEGSSCLGELIPIEEPVEECGEDSFKEEGVSCLGELMPIEEEEVECNEDSFIEEGDSCLGELIPINEGNECSENSFKDEDDSCVGELIPIDKIVDEECSEDSFKMEGDSCLGELIPIEIIIVDEEECSKDSFKVEGDSCLGELIPIKGIIPKDEECSADSFKEDGDSCSGDLILIEEYKPLLPKKLCDGEGSFKTVYAQRCNVRNLKNTAHRQFFNKTRSDDSSTCMMGSEGFSFCDTEHLWWRDDHWYDWDLCSLCTQDQGPLTTSGYLCDGECHNNWNNGESLAPRCKVTKKEGNTTNGVPDKDYCTTCVGSTCPNNSTAPRDERAGSEVGHIVWQQEESEDNEK